MVRTGRPSGGVSVPRRHEIDELAAAAWAGLRAARASREPVTARMPTRLRFAGGPLDGRELASAGAAETYRMAGGAYHAATASGDDGLTYEWRPDPAERWHDHPRLG